MLCTDFLSCASQLINVFSAYLGFHITHDARLLPSSEGLLCYRTSVMWIVSIKSDRIPSQDLVSLAV